MSSKEEGSSSSSSLESGKKKKSGTMVVLRSSEGETFEVEEKALMCSQTLRHMIEDDCAVTAIPLPNVTAPVLAKIVDYCNRHPTAATASLQDLKTFDSDFLDLDHPMLFDLLLAANYLDITSLLDSTCQAVADMMKGKSPEEIRTLFNIKNDFTEEEEAEVRRENAWAFE